MQIGGFLSVASPPKRIKSVGYAAPSGEKPFLFVDYGWEEALERTALRPRRTIAQDQIDVYVEWKGNEDLYWRTRARDPRMSDEAWTTIGSLLQKMHSVVNGQGSRRYRDAVQAELAALVPDRACQDALWRRAGQSNRGHQDPVTGTS
jgi:hypothetical protein